MSQLPTVYLTRRLPDSSMERLQRESNLIHGDLDRAPSREEFLQGVKRADGIICVLTETIDTEVLEANPDLKVVSNYAVGYNNIDVEAASRCGVAITNTPDVLTDCTADMAWALLMSAARRVVEGDALVRSGKWTGWEPLQLLGAQVTGATIGFIGFGRIGQATAKRARAFDMRMLYWNRTRLTPDQESELGVEYCPIDDLLPECDFVSIHVALTPETRHLISTDQLTAMKSNAILINTARGPVVDEQALVRAIQNGEIAGAGLDVYENEPAVEPELREMPNVVLAPHLGSATIETRTQMATLAIENCLAACRGERPPNQVN